jgi:hypothetical protein
MSKRGRFKNADHRCSEKYQAYNRDPSSIQIYRHFSDKNAAKGLVLDDFEYSVSAIKDSDFAECFGTVNGSHLALKIEGDRWKSVGNPTLRWWGEVETFKFKTESCPYFLLGAYQFPG